VKDELVRARDVLSPARLADLYFDGFAEVRSFAANRAKLCFPDHNLTPLLPFLIPQIYVNGKWMKSWVVVKKVSFFTAQITSPTPLFELQ
tara:strand:+ start:541 stop:810 length:270 start_codon:yes stop_codon:yes gene_type:complete